MSPDADGRAIRSDYGAGVLPPEQNSCAHIILTRFNVRTPGREERVRTRPGWLAERFQLFERFCLPTVATQTTQNFTWLVYFDDETPPEFCPRIDAYRRYPFFRPYFVNYEELSLYREHIAALFSERPEWLLTTNLDNDDGWHREFVASLHQHLKFGAPAVFNFEQGLVYNNGRIYLRKDRCNPFASFLEPFDHIRTIWGEQHIHLSRLGHVIQIDAQPLWLQVVHDKNVSNWIRGDRTLRGEVLDGFAIREDAATDEARWEVLLDQIVWRRHRAGRDSAIKVYKYFRTLVRVAAPNEPGPVDELSFLRGAGKTRSYGTGDRAKSWALSISTTIRSAARRQILAHRATPSGQAQHERLRD